MADVYERGRPNYPPAVVDALTAELGIGPGARVLDLAAGTGKLTWALAAAGLDVVAVEPQSELRDVLAASIGGERVLDGLAEAIPLPDGSVAAVTVADGFHWFDQAAALREIRRVLAPGGGLAVIFTVPDFRVASWLPEVGSLLQARRPEHPGFDGPPWTDAVRAAGGWSEPHQVEVTTDQPASPERAVDYFASASWVAALPERERAELLGHVRELVDAGETPGEIPVHTSIGVTALS